MEPCASNENDLAPQTRDFYRHVVTALAHSQLPFLVGGAYALGCYTGITRDTKDFDIFVRPREVGAILEALARAGYRTDLTDAVWLGKAYFGDAFVDVIFNAGNGLAPVDDEWFEHAVDGELLGAPLKLIPAEEMIWQKAFVMTRDRYDGADIAHVLRARAELLDWPRLVRRFGPDWRVLYHHLIVFGYIYPSERARIPNAVMQDFNERLQQELAALPPTERVCRGTLLSTTQYVMDVGRWGYRDARE
ncbi:MAG: hypothetical protein HY782_01340 [Chloroflexi bacterium]|nr:hypothetical protein [Chloroflexota bacterium]